ncbi:10421_t:CDS:1 [Ambispora leptoticha]|uniref:10421_t:CDS:1 n=1 Tax=Ambispora leptoticha TaxID=144679 RepID=A0A9N9EKD8_9GLOM|nr:10421_t:CDS:1 [Ambispora leptoticha]
MSIPIPTAYTNTLRALPDRAHILHLYRGFLRAGSKFSNYNFRDYVKRRARDQFRMHKNETDPHKIMERVKKAEKELLVWQRQGYLNSLYRVDPLVIESEEKNIRKDKNKILLRGQN